MQKEKVRREPRAAAYFFSILESLDGLADTVGRAEAAGGAKRQDANRKTAKRVWRQMTYCTRRVSLAFSSGGEPGDRIGAGRLVTGCTGPPCRTAGELGLRLAASLGESESLRGRGGACGGARRSLLPTGGTFCGL